MAFTMCETHLHREVHAAGDLSYPLQQGIGIHLQTTQNNGKGSSRARNTSTNTRFTTVLPTEQGTLSQQQEGDNDAADENTREDRNNQQ